MRIKSDILTDRDFRSMVPLYRHAPALPEADADCLPGPGDELGTCELVSRPHRRDHCGEAWRPLPAPSAGPVSPTPPRRVAAEHFYGKGTSNFGCCSAACKNCEYGGKDYECELCELEKAIAALLAERPVSPSSGEKDTK